MLLITLLILDVIAFLPVGMLLPRVFFRFEAVIGTIRVESAGLSPIPSLHVGSLLSPPRGCRGYISGRRGSVSSSLTAPGFGICRVTCNFFKILRPREDKGVSITFGRHATLTISSLQDHVRSICLSSHVCCLLSSVLGKLPSPL